MLSEVSPSTDASFTSRSSSSNDSSFSEADMPDTGPDGGSSKPSWTRTGGYSCTATANSQVAGNADYQAVLLASEGQEVEPSR
jgi:hypothetical protein